MARTKAAVAPFMRESKILSAQKKLVPVQLHLPPAHPAQHDLITAFEKYNCRFVVGAAGTKFGKTFGCAERLVLEAWNNKDSLNWWVAPSYSQSKNAYSLIKKLLPQGFYKEYKADLKLEILEPDGSVRSVIEFKSGDNPDTLRGFGVHFAVMDEAARMPYESYISVLTTLTQTMGRGMIISTPKGRGWFFEVYQKGSVLRDQFPEFYSIRMATWLNPHVQNAAIEQMKRNMPEDTFRQEVCAEFLMDSAGVFRGIKECVKGTLEEPITGRGTALAPTATMPHAYVMGVDLARLRDFTVLTVMDRQRKHVVYHERFNQIQWAVQYQRIIETAKRYNNALVVVDTTGIGDPIVENLRNAGLNIEPYKIGGSSAKQQLIEKLRVSIEQQHVSYPNIPVLISELMTYEYEVTDSGVVKYSAPEGFHDDAVISLALCNWVVDNAPFVYRFRNIRGI